MRSRVAALLLSCGALLSSTHASATPATPTGGDEPFVALLTFTPGEHPFALFGHTALWVHDPRQPHAEDIDLAYNYGTFDFGSPTVVPRFLSGRLSYWLSIASLDWTLSTYGSEKRGITAQILNLDPTVRDDLIRKLSFNAQPEHRSYRYDFVRDNCSTRVRDMVDIALAGRLRAATQSRPASTWRQQILRMASRDPLTYIGLDLALSAEADQPITAWDEAFLPDRLHDEITRLATKEPSLVDREVGLLSGGTPAPSAAPSWLSSYVLTGLVGSFLVLGFAYTRRAKRLAQIALGLTTTALGAFAGASGFAMLWFWIGTNVRITHHNENLLLMLPWSLGLIPVGLTIARGRPRFRAFAKLIASSLVVSSTLLALIKLTPFSTQQNHGQIALWLPVWYALAIALRHVHFVGEAGAPGAGGLASLAPDAGGGGALRSGGGGPP
ncbi:MAG: DUF4105 domain-containing protein [Polyangiaceae bacterium]